MFGFGAKTKCAKCESTAFRLKTIEPIGSNFTLNAVHCNKCGAPFGVVQNQNVGAMLEGQRAMLEGQKMLIADLGSKIDRMASQMDEIANTIARRSGSYR